MADADFEIGLDKVAKEFKTVQKEIDTTVKYLNGFQKVASDINKASMAKLYKDVQTFNGSLKDATKIMQNFNVAVELAMNKQAQTFSTVEKGMGKVTDVATAKLKILEDGIDKVLAKANLLNGNTNLTGSAKTQFQPKEVYAAQNLKTQINPLLSSTTQQSKDIQSFQKELTGLNKETLKYQQSLAKMGSSIGAFKQNVSTSVTELTRLRQELVAIQSKNKLTNDDFFDVKNIKKQINEISSGLKKDSASTKIFDGLDTDIENLSKKLPILSNKFTDLSNKNSVYGTRLQALQKDYDLYNNKVQESTNALKQLQSAEEGLKKVMSPETQKKMADLQHQIAQATELRNKASKDIAKTEKLQTKNTDELQIIKQNINARQKELDIMRQTSLARKQEMAEVRAGISLRQQQAAETLRVADAIAQGNKQFSGLRGLLGEAGAGFRGLIYDLNAFRIAFTLVFATTGISKMVGVVSQFDEAMNRSRALMVVAQGDSAKLRFEYNLLSQEVQRLGATTKFTSREVADAQVILTQAGLNARQSIQLLKPVLDLAVAGNVGMEQSASTLIKTLKMYNMDFSEARDVADIFTTTIINSTVNMEELALSMKYAGSISSNFGLQMSDTAAMIGVLADKGIQGSMAGTGLRMAMVNLVSPTEKARKTLEAFGITQEQMNKQNLKGMDYLVKVLKTLKESGASTSVLSQIFDTRSLNVITSLVNSTEQLDIALARFANSDASSSAKLMEESMKNLGSQIVQVKAALEQSWITLMNNTGATSAFTSILRNLADLIRFLNQDTTVLGATLVGLVGGFILWLKAVKNINIAMKANSIELFKMIGGQRTLITTLNASALSTINFNNALKLLKVTVAGTATALLGIIKLLAPMALVAGAFYALERFLQPSALDSAVEKYKEFWDMNNGGAAEFKQALESVTARIEGLTKTEQEVELKRATQEYKNLQDQLLKTAKAKAIMQSASGFVGEDIQYISNQPSFDIFKGMIEEGQLAEVIAEFDAGGFKDIFQTAEIRAEMVKLLKAVDMGKLNFEAIRKGTQDNVKINKQYLAGIQDIIGSLFLLDEVNLVDINKATEEFSNNLNIMRANIPTKEIEDMFKGLQKSTGIGEITDYVRYTGESFELLEKFTKDYTVALEELNRIKSLPQTDETEAQIKRLDELVNKYNTLKDGLQLYNDEYTKNAILVQANSAIQTKNANDIKNVNAKNLKSFTETGNKMKEAFENSIGSQLFSYVTNLSNKSISEVEKLKNQILLLQSSIQQINSQSSQDEFIGSLKMTAGLLKMLSAQQILDLQGQVDIHQKDLNIRQKILDVSRQLSNIEFKDTLEETLKGIDLKSLEDMLLIETDQKVRDAITGILGFASAVKNVYEAEAKSRKKLVQDTDYKLLLLQSQKDFLSFNDILSANAEKMLKVYQISKQIEQARKDLDLAGKGTEKANDIQKYIDMLVAYQTQVSKTDVASKNLLQMQKDTFSYSEGLSSELDYKLKIFDIDQQRMGLQQSMQNLSKIDNALRAETAKQIAYINGLLDEQARLASLARETQPIESQRAFVGKQIEYGEATLATPQDLYKLRQLDAELSNKQKDIEISKLDPLKEQDALQIQRLELEKQITNELLRQSDPTNASVGALKGAKEYINSLLDYNKQMQDAVKSTLDGMTNGVVDSIHTAMQSLWDESIKTSDAIRQIWYNLALDIAKQFMQIGVNQLVGNIFSSIANAGLGAFSVGGSATNTFGAGLEKYGKLGSALKYASGGIITKPTYALMGEAGRPEVVLPAVKTPSGDYGVKVSGSKNQGAVSFAPVISINVEGGSGSKQDNTALANEISSNLKNVMRAEMNNMIREQKRYGGALA